MAVHNMSIGTISFAPRLQVLHHFAPSTKFFCLACDGLSGLALTHTHCSTVGHQQAYSQLAFRIPFGQASMVRTLLLICLDVGFYMATSRCVTRRRDLAEVKYPAWRPDFHEAFSGRQVTELFSPRGRDRGFLVLSWKYGNRELTLASR
jgi:hypothetical protein